MIVSGVPKIPPNPPPLEPELPADAPVLPAPFVLETNAFFVIPNLVKWVVQTTISPPSSMTHSSPAFNWPSPLSPSTDVKSFLTQVVSINLAGSFSDLMNANSP